MPATWKRLAGPVAATLALYAALMTLHVCKQGGHPSALVCAGRNRVGQPPYEAIVAPGGPNGYDGQFYYAIARDPWRAHLGELIDDPPARHELGTEALERARRRFGEDPYYERLMAIYR